MNPEVDSIETTAADWFSRREFGLSPSESAQLLEWLNADPRHARMFAQFEQTSRYLDGMAEPVPVQKKSPLRRLTQIAGLAASLAIAGLLTWQFTRSEDFTLTTETDSQGYRILDLPDGSVVRLNANTLAQVHYTSTERRIHLSKGEALFTVAHDSKHPFYVDSSGVSVRAVGTAFNVRVQDHSIEVLVTEGKVRVEDSVQRTSLLPSSTSESILAAGQRVVVSLVPSQPPPPVAAVESLSEPAQSELLAWQDKRLSFGAVPLSQVVEEFNRYHSRKLVIDDPDLGKEEFGGTFRADGTETFLSLLERNFDVTVDRRENETILRRRSR